MVTIGLIGHGRWGANIEKTLRSFSDVTFVSVEKNDPIHPELAGICIATPSSTHFEIALPYVEKGIATFIEKPMTTSIADAEALYAAALKSGALIHVGHIHLFNPAFCKVLELLPQIGPITAMFCEGLNDKPRTDSSVLWDWLPHDLSMALSVFGSEPKGVQAWTIGEPLSHTAITKFQFGNAMLMSVMSWLSPSKRKTTTITGQKGSITLDDTEEKKITLKIGDEISHPDYGKEMPLTQELRAFVDAVAQKKSDTKSLETGVAIVRLIAAAETSAKNNSESITLAAFSQ